jgi:hypothetical protein
MTARMSVALLGALACTSCDRLASFDLEPGEAYCGRIALGSQYRQGLTPRVQMRMSFDAEAVDRGESPGVITTYDAEGEPARLLDGATLRPFKPIAFDALSDMAMGDGREHNLIYAASAAEEGAESFVVIVSLRSDDGVEVRLIRPGLGAEEGGDDNPLRRPTFGLFNLARRTGDCGF